MLDFPPTPVPSSLSLAYSAVLSSSTFSLTELRCCSHPIPQSPSPQLHLLGSTASTASLFLLHPPSRNYLLFSSLLPAPPIMVQPTSFLDWIDAVRYASKSKKTNRQNLTADQLPTALVDANEKQQEEHGGHQEAGPKGQGQRGGEQRVGDSTCMLSSAHDPCACSRDIHMYTI